MAAVDAEFGRAYDSRRYMREMIQVEQTGSVLGYKTQFEAALYKVRAYSKSCTEEFFVNHLVMGLKDELRYEVEIQLPESLRKTVLLAQIQEEKWEKLKIRPPKTLVVQKFGGGA